MSKPRIHAFAVAFLLVVTVTPAAAISTTDGPFVQGPFVQGPFVQGPFVQGPFVQGDELERVDLDLATMTLDGNAYFCCANDGTDLVAIRWVTPDILEWRTLTEVQFISNGQTYGPYPAGMVGAVFDAQVSGTHQGQLVDATVQVRIAEILGPDDSETRMEGPGVQPANTPFTVEDFTSNSDILLVRLEIADDQGSWKDLCAGADSDERAGFFLPGTWNADGSYSGSGTTFTCLQGAASKCARTLGYKPWKSLPRPNDGIMQDLEPLYEACVRATRADYCADGTSYTVAGTMINIWDDYDFNLPETSAQMHQWLEDEAALQGGGPGSEIIGNSVLYYESMFDDQENVTLSWERHESLDPVCGSNPPAMATSSTIYAYDLFGLEDPHIFVQSFFYYECIMPPRPLPQEPICSLQPVPLTVAN